MKKYDIEPYIDETGAEFQYVPFADIRKGFEGGARAEGAVKAYIDTLTPEEKERMVKSVAQKGLGVGTRAVFTTYVSQELLARMTVEGKISPYKVQGEGKFVEAKLLEAGAVTEWKR